jgi:hypothetical protein
MSIEIQGDDIMPSITELSLNDVSTDPPADPKIPIDLGTIPGFHITFTQNSTTVNSDNQYVIGFSIPNVPTWANLDTILDNKTTQLQDMYALAYKALYDETITSYSVMTSKYANVSETMTAELGIPIRDKLRYMYNSSYTTNSQIYIQVNGDSTYTAVTSGSSWSEAIAKTILQNLLNQNFINPANTSTALSSSPFTMLNNIIIGSSTSTYDEYQLRSNGLVSYVRV